MGLAQFYNFVLLKPGADPKNLEAIKIWLHHFFNGPLYTAFEVPAIKVASFGPSIVGSLFPLTAI
jgi:hypothetical protein